MKRITLAALIALICITSLGQSPSPARPKLVVGVILDQMRWDYLYRYHDLYAPDGGFKRFLNQG
ncbi:MAG: hypothetical protein RL447_617, partial [Bacteroidota bacterium]